MNYEKIYNQLVEKCRVRGLDKSKYEGYFETHHIVPKCLGGDNSEDNLVMFTGREHFIAHILLWKLNPGHKGLSYSLNIMNNRINSKKLNSKLYNRLKEVSSPRPKEKDGHMFKDKTGTKVNSLTVLGISEWITKPSGQKLVIWDCVCDCGAEIKVRGNHLNPKGTKSCGCLTLKGTKDYYSKLRPWAVSNKMADKWRLADKYYQHWVTLDQPTSCYKFKKLISNLDVSLPTDSSFTAMLREFSKGWIPLEDGEWIKFSKGINNE